MWQYLCEYNLPACASPPVCTSLRHPARNLLLAAAHQTPCSYNSKQDMLIFYHKTNQYIPLSLFLIKYLNEIFYFNCKIYSHLRHFYKIENLLKIYLHIERCQIFSYQPCRSYSTYVLVRSHCQLGELLIKINVIQFYLTIFFSLNPISMILNTTMPQSECM